jgi:hypothetical protein
MIDSTGKAGAKAGVPLNRQVAHFPFDVRGARHHRRQVGELSPARRYYVAP